MNAWSITCSVHTVAVQLYVAVLRQRGTFLKILLKDNTVQADFYKYREMRKRPLVTCGGMGRVANTSGTSVKYISLPEHVTATPSAEFCS